MTFKEFAEIHHLDGTMGASFCRSVLGSELFPWAGTGQQQMTWLQRYKPSLVNNFISAREEFQKAVEQELALCLLKDSVRAVHKLAKKKQPVTPKPIQFYGCVPQSMPYWKGVR